VTGNLPPRLPGERSAHDFVRPFVLTGGRTRTNDASLHMETMVQTVDDAPGRLTFEHARIVDACWEPRSVAEVAAEMSAGMGKRESIAAVAARNGVPKKIVYQAVLDNAPGEEG